MDKAERTALFTLPVVLIIAAGLALAGSQESASAAGIPLFGLCVALAFLIQWIAFIPAYLMKTEKFFDLTGSITYIAVAVVAVVLNPLYNGRGLILLVLVVIWAARLGLFLFKRVQTAGEDRRFREIKTSFSRSLLTWTLQGLWVSFTLAAALAVMTATSTITLGVFTLIGYFVWLVGFVIEVYADWQKRKFNEDPANEDKFISSGLWSWSRHPNYFGEILLWIGVAIIAWPVLHGWTLLTLISPVFVIILLTRISGLPMLEERADKKWGGQVEYEDYKARTSVLIPWPPERK